LLKITLKHKKSKAKVKQKEEEQAPPLRLMVQQSFSRGGKKSQGVEITTEEKKRAYMII
jgi:hypothetical protein